MISRSLLLVLLVLACLQSFTTAQNEDIPEQCCFRFSTNPIPVKLISAYVETDPQCPKPGVIFTLKNGGLRCGDPSVEWVQDLMNTINQRLSKTPTEKPDKPVSTASLRRNAHLTATEQEDIFLGGQRTEEIHGLRKRGEESMRLLEM
ncbi:C-C motif chemokine 4 homolog isoform X3 [Hemibagrus wyckioides]|uniref:C-C motif chemokine 4 homolog isoform X3 n=1 Tax=Hemibagrus wyckioides TaxID=337641 RepID=UPI00266C1956|nr:C-C motif chemokine 4 homolog isoform X3 [Hemibagrus wyckioides]